jgi:hypothetical protein
MLSSNSKQYNLNMQAAQNHSPTLKGYLYLLIENYNAPGVQAPISCHVSLGLIAKCNTAPSPSGTPVNEVFLLEVPEDPSRLVF